ncbi:hypothetical protein [Halostagnicola kamekurae]|nr:hypothetical protein [Halostagnicola kamekurae]
MTVDPMDLNRLKPIYLFGIVLNACALVYAGMAGSWLYAGAFVLVLGYLAFRYRMIART